MLLATIQVVLLGLWASSLAERTRATIATAVLNLVTSIVLGLLSQYEHTRSIRPSTVNAGYLFLSTVLSLPEARTLYFLETTRAIPILFTVTLCLKVITLLVESVPKTSILKRAYQNPPPESATGILGLSFFTWINPLLLLGNKTDLTVELLPTLDESFCAKGVVPNGLEKTWRKSGFLFPLPAQVTFLNLMFIC